MALTATLYRFKIELTDLDRGVYETLQLRVPRHPSEGEAFLLTRVIAYALCYREGLEFSPGLSTEDEPTLSVRDPSSGGYLLWVEIGSPSARRLNKAAKAAREVRVYTYKDPAALVRELEGERVHRIGEVQAFALDPRALGRLAEALARDNEWVMLVQDGALTLAAGGAEGEAFSLEAVQLVHG